SSAQSTTDSLKNIITAADETRTALEKLSSFQDSMHVLGLHGFIRTSDTENGAGSDTGVSAAGAAAVPIDITLMKNGGVARNGIISGSPHSTLAEELGEDCLVAVKEGEGFVPPKQVDEIKNILELINNSSANVPSLSELYAETIRRIDNAVYNSVTLPTPEYIKDTIGNNIVFQSGAFNINLNEMRDVTALGEAIVRELPNIVTRKLNPRP
ncbi:MAG: hypothetical protein NC086_10260, partial [Alistipes sp.]|nr:hypothetical protein [Alistipes sp.]